MNITPQIKAVLHNSGISVDDIMPIFAEEEDLLKLTHNGTITAVLLVDIYRKIATNNDDMPQVFSIDTETGKHTFKISYPFNNQTEEIERHIKLIKAVNNE